MEKISIQKVLVSVGVCLGLMIVASSSVQAEVTIPVESFTGANAVSDNWIAGGFPNSACLTAGNDLARTPIPGCQMPRIDEIGSGVFRLTYADYDQSGYLLYNSPLPSGDGLDAFFYASQWGGDGADGLAFFFTDGEYELTAPGGNGGSLGYAAKFAGDPDAQEGVAHALLGIGFDTYGAFHSSYSDGNGCTGGAGGTENQVVVRGAGNGLDGYCYIDGVDLTPMGISLSGDSREEAAHLIRVRVDSAKVAERKVRIFIDGARVLTVDLPEEFLAAETVKFGWTAGTGGFTNYHEIWGATVRVIPESIDFEYEAPTLEDDLEAISSTTTQVTEETLVATGAQTNHQPLFGLLALSLGFALVGFGRRRRLG
jgi:hypothetical protein